MEGDAMDARSRLALAAGAVLAAPAAFAVAALALRAVGIVAPAQLADAAFSAFGVTNASPLPMRQAWYFGTYILAPLMGAGIALTAFAEPAARTRWAAGALGACGTLIAAFWTVRSLVDD
jgi:hypothetical protein